MYIQPENTKTLQNEYIHFYMYVFFLCTLRFKSEYALIFNAFFLCASRFESEFTLTFKANTRLYIHTQRELYNYPRTKTLYKSPINLKQKCLYNRKDIQPTCCVAPLMASFGTETIPSTSTMDSRLNPETYFTIGRLTTSGVAVTTHCTV